MARAPGATDQAVAHPTVREGARTKAARCPAFGAAARELFRYEPLVLPSGNMVTHRERRGAAPARRATEAYRLVIRRKERNAAGAAFGGNPKGRGIIWAHRGVARRLFGTTKRRFSRLALHPKLPPSRSCAKC